MSINTKRLKELDTRYKELVHFIAPNNLEEVREIISEIVELELLIEEDCNK